MNLVRRLLRGKAVEPVSVAAPAAIGTPAYYEAWGGLESANRALWAALWLAATVALLSLLLLRIEASRPPVVIRVTDSGRAELLADPGRQPPVSDAEIKNFLALFERFFTELNAYTYEQDLRLAFSMMTPEFREKADAMLKGDGVVEALKAEDRATKLFLGELEVVRDTPAYFECRVKGYREVGSYKPDAASREVVFEHEIILKKVPRSASAPYGVLVEGFRESLFKR